MSKLENGVDLDVVTKAYGWTVDDDWKIYGLTAGDHGYEDTGIRLDPLTREALDGASNELELVTRLKAFYNSDARRREQLLSTSKEFYRLIDFAAKYSLWDADPLAGALEGKFAPAPDKNDVCVVCREHYPRTGQQAGPVWAVWSRNFQVCRRCVQAGRDARRRG